MKKIKLKQTYIKRVIVHPSFKNISFRESEKLMEQMDQGEVIVRPSSKVNVHQHLFLLYLTRCNILMYCCYLIKSPLKIADVCCNRVIIIICLFRVIFFMTIGYRPFNCYLESCRWRVSAYRRKGRRKRERF